ncbi:MAG: hypothetical protein MRY64_04690 [Hyphomonadaceae bacterium]|nr:hypothetical protein [Hyphomonadaceae bacterium]
MSVASTSASVHMGGLLGAGGLFLVLAGCAMLQSYQQDTAASFVPGRAASSIAAPDGAGVMTGASQESPHVTTTAPDEAVDPVAVPVALVEMPEPEVQPETRPVSIPEPDILPDPAPALPATVVTPPPVAPPPQPQPRPVQVQTYPTRQADFIIKFKANETLDTVISTWRRDRAGAEAAFRDWAASDPLFSQMKISGCSYSGELVLSTEVGGGAQPAEAEVDALVRAIRAHGAVVYADPDFTAHPGTRGN